jgi:hypothetical protein
MWLRRFMLLLPSLPVLAACGETAPSSGSAAPSTPRVHGWLELAGDPDVSPAELSSLLYASLAPDQRSALDRLAAEASRTLGQPLTGADMLRFEGLPPGQRVRTVETAPDGKLRVALDNIRSPGPAGDGASRLLPEPLLLEQAGEPRGLLLPGLVTSSAGGR